LLLGLKLLSSTEPQRPLLGDSELGYSIHQTMSNEPKLEEIAVGKDANALNLEDLKKTITIDTLHNDEALKVLAKYTGDETWTAAEEKKLTRKIDRRLLSILCVTFGLQYYDKAMLSQAVLISPTPTVTRDYSLIHDRHSLASAPISS